MSLNPNQQIFQVIKSNQKILIVFKKIFSIDSIASALALFLILKKMNKSVDVVCDQFILPERLKFLPRSELVMSKISNLQKFIISLNIKESGLNELSYYIKNEQLNINLSPRQGNINLETLKTSTSNYKYGLIFVIDSPDLESLGNIYHQNRDFFYNTAIVNIDRSPENEIYGQINLNNPNAIATAEILFDLIESFGGELLDFNVATCLLSGMIAKTKGFKIGNITPKSLNNASLLIKAGADRQLIIKNLFRSQELSTLNLWGRALAKLKTDLDNKLAWTIITELDIIESRSRLENLNGVVDELIASIPGVEIIILLIQKNQNVEVLISSLKNKNAMLISRQFNSEGSKVFAKFLLRNKNIIEAETEVVEAIKRNLIEFCK